MEQKFSEHRAGHLRLVFIESRQQRYRRERAELAEQFAKMAADLARQATDASEEARELRLASAHWQRGAASLLGAGRRREGMT